jgi:DNA-directed RNA polymerase subunit RPC12/RpoP
MKIEVICPQCGEKMRVRPGHASYELKCPNCSHWFLPLEDTGVECPRCGEKVMVSYGNWYHISCPACRYSFGRRKSPLFWLLICVGIAGGVSLFVLLAGSLPFDWAVNRPYGNESSAISMLRTISSCEELFVTRYGRYATLRQLADKNLLDSQMKGGSRYGYYFDLNPSGSQSWWCVAYPREPGTTGSRSFYINETGVLRWMKCESMNDLPADSNSLPLGR